MSVCVNMDVYLIIWWEAFIMKKFQYRNHLHVLYWRIETTIRWILLLRKKRLGQNRVLILIRDDYKPYIWDAMPVFFDPLRLNSKTAWQQSILLIDSVVQGYHIRLRCERFWVQFPVLVTIFITEMCKYVLNTSTAYLFLHSSRVFYDTCLHFDWKLFSMQQYRSTI